MRALGLLLFLTAAACAQQASVPRLASGKPNMQGIWRSKVVAPAFNIEQQEATFQSPSGASVIVDPPGGKLPYTPAARRQATENFEQRFLDPVGFCHPHGVPRIVYPPFPFEIIQDGDYFATLHETEHSVRIIPLDGRPHRKNYVAWNGDSRGRWEGDTLVVDVRGLNGKTWLDQSGNFTGPTQTVIERWTMTGPNAITYEATTTDPSTFTRPWTIRLTLERQPPGTELIEYDCVEGERDNDRFRAMQKERERSKK